MMNWCGNRKGREVRKVLVWIGFFRTNLVVKPLIFYY